MAVDDALRFLRETRDDAALRAELERLGRSASIEDVIRLTASRGMAFTAEELQTAFKVDWGLQWARCVGRRR